MRRFKLLALIFFLIPFFAYAERAPRICKPVEDLGEPPPPYAYDQGPDRDRPDGREMIDIIAEMPHMPEVSNQLTDDQKFRYHFGPVLWRKASDYPMKIWFRGQDATHIAEAAGRTATAAFGGRAQDLAKHFGVNEGAGFSNAYPYTIQGQYGSFDAPIIFFEEGKATVRHMSYVDNHLWTMTHEGPLAEWNQKFTEAMIKQNPELAMVVLFGGASRDTAATFVNNLKGGYVGSKYSKQDMKNIQVPEMKLMPAGGNNQFPVPVDAQGRDLYAEFLGRTMNYKSEKDQTDAKAAMQKNLAWFMKRMVFSKGGPYGNGVINPAQIGGYDLDHKMRVNGTQTISLKGLTLSDGTVIDRDILLSQLPHPTALSRDEMEEPGSASRKVGIALKAFDRYRKAGWHIEADPGQVNHYAQGDPYEYGRTDIGPEFYDFGTPKNRMVSVSSASRMKRAPWGIIFGTTKPAKFDQAQLAGARSSEPSEKLDPREIWTSHGGFLPGHLYVPDSGPGEKWAKLMKENLDLTTIFEPKKGKSWEKDGIAAYNVKSHPEAGDFGHYRGTFNKPRVFILADPRGYDDVGTSRALTGARGQYLHGIMDDVGVGDHYLVLKTVPFAMDGASDAEWSTVLRQTSSYRENVIRALVAEHKPEVIVADGPRAKAELERILGKSVKIVAIQRGETDAYGIAAGGKQIAERLGSHARITGAMKDIPRSHLPYLSHFWEGRGGDHVFSSIDKFRGQAFGVMVPKYASKQKVELDPVVQQMVDDQLKRLRDFGLRLPGESIPDYLARRQREQEAVAPARRAAGGVN